MSALYGKQDSLLETGRFFRFLRQAHDAEVADVRKLGEDDYELMGRGIESAPAVAASSPARCGAFEGRPAALAPVADGAAVRGGMRFRRGARLGSASAVIPMIGVVSLEEEAVAAPVKKAKSGRKKSVKAASADPVAAVAETPPKKKAASRAKPRKKAAEE